MFVVRRKEEQVGDSKFENVKRIGVGQGKNEND